MNREMAKFAIYILFPITTLYIYNRPELHNSIVFKDQNDAIESFKRKPEDNHVNLPQDISEIRQVIEKLKKNVN